MFVGVSVYVRNRLHKPCVPIRRFSLFVHVRPDYCHGHCQATEVMKITLYHSVWRQLGTLVSFDSRPVSSTQHAGSPRLSGQPPLW